MAITRIRDIRRRELLEAALEIIKREGLPATTLSRIADHAGVSKGIVHHYFRGKDQLIEETMRYAHSRRRDDLVRGLISARDPVQRLSAVISVILDEKYFQHGFCRAWISFKAATYSSPALARLHRVIHRREWSNLTHALCSFQPRSEASKTAISIKAMVEGYRFRLAAVPPADFDSRVPVNQVLGFLRQRVPGFEPTNAVPRF
jgi:TetR/AcrR family transcriptional regulator, transcriptional repressor of bet genes